MLLSSRVTCFCGCERRTRRETSRWRRIRLQSAGGKDEDALHTFRAAVAVDPRVRLAKRDFLVTVRGSPWLIAGGRWRAVWLLLLIFAMARA
jgi:hypothetical protein